MILYNITFNVSAACEEDFVSWMKTIHIPEVMGTGIFHHQVFYRLVHHSEDGSLNFCIQYFTESMDRMLEYERVHAPALRKKTQERYQDQVVAFRTLLETI
jgi:Fic family protein